METVRKFSRKREAVYAALRSTDSHPSAEWVYSRLKPDFPDLSLATVYRNLSLFRQEGAAIVVATIGGQDRFDARTQPHPHFICDNCGAVLDMPDFPSGGAKTAPEGFEGGEIKWREILFHGTCARCLKDTKSNNKS